MIFDPVLKDVRVKVRCRLHVQMRIRSCLLLNCTHCLRVVTVFCGRGQSTLLLATVEGRLIASTH